MIIESEWGEVQNADNRRRAEMKLWDRIERGMEAGFDAAVSAVHVLTEKAGEGIELTRLRREKARLETQITRRLAELGNAVFEKISADRLDDITDRLGIQEILLDVAENEARLVDIDRGLKKELEREEAGGEAANTK
jgi:hypothetical protein